MKRLISLIFISIFAFSFAYPQDTDNYELQEDELNELQELRAEKQQQEYEAEQQRIWGKGRFTRLGYAFAQTSGFDGTVDKGKYAFFFQKGTTFRLHKKPLANMIKIGLDAVWIDFQYSKYKNHSGGTTNWTSEFETIQDNNWWDDEEDESFNLNLGKSAINIGMGIGPNITVAPFSLSSSKALQPLRASVYFHYAPTLGLYLMSYDGEMEVSTGFCNMFNFGCELHYRFIGIGVEGRWGHGKFTSLDFESMIDDEETINDLGRSNKYTRRFANTRLFVQFTF